MARRSSLGEIREFVYLDETSVESMLAAVDGEILVQTTESSGRSSELTLGSTQKSDAMFGSPDVTTGLKLGRSSGSQETRKSVAQSAFARFRRNNAASFVLRKSPHTYRWWVKRQLLARNPKALLKHRVGVPLAALKRGDLFELEATLSAADIYQVRTAINAVGEVVESFPSFLPLEEREVFRQVRPLTALIDTLNADAIPVDVIRPSLEIDTVDGEEWLLLTPGRSTESLALEAATMPEWFWGDIGRTLFQSRRFTLLCRVVDPQLRSASAGSYVGTILRTIHPQLATTVDAFGPMMMGALRQGSAQAANAGALGAWVLAYASSVEDLTGVEVSGQDWAKTPALASIDMRQTPMSKQLEIFGAIDAAFGVVPGTRAAELAQVRNAIRNEHGLWPWSPPASPRVTTPEVAQPSRIEVELVAAYW